VSIPRYVATSPARVYVVVIGSRFVAIILIVMLLPHVLIISSLIM